MHATPGIVIAYRFVYVDRGSEESNTARLTITRKQCYCNME